MFFFIALVLLGLVALGGLAAGVFGKTRTNSYGDSLPVKRIGFAVAGAALILLGIVSVFTSATVVGARSVGVETSFGQYKGTLNPGLHFIAPWANVESFSTRVQYLNLDSRDGGPNIRVKYDGGGGGNADAVVRWRITEPGAKLLWEKYKTFDNVRDQLVDSSSQDSFRVILGGYAPVDAIAGKNIRPVSLAVKTDLTSSVTDDGVYVDSVSLKNVTLDADVQKTLDRAVSAAGLVVVATQEQNRAVIDAQTAKIRENGGSLTPAALQRYCYEVTNSWDVHKNGQLPATWNCATNSSSTPVIVNGR